MGAVADLQIIASDAGVAPEHYDATEISANAFALLGQRPIIGRDFTSADEAPGAVHVTILSYRFWERRYGKYPAIIGQTLRINGTPTTIVGVMPQGFSFPQNQDVWLPLVRTPDSAQRETRRLWFAFGRMRDGITFESARAELAMIGQRLASAYPATNEGWVPQPRTFTDFFVRDQRDGDLWVDVGRGRFRAADRVRQSRESAAGARDRSVARDVGPHRARRGAMANHPATPHRERHAVVDGRRSPDGGSRNGACACTTSRRIRPRCRGPNICWTTRWTTECSPTSSRFRSAPDCCSASRRR